MIFAVPAIALILVVLMFIYFLQRVGRKDVFKRLVFTILIMAFLFNFVWEVIQMPLYRDAPFSVAHIAFCGLASIADALMVLLIYLSFALVMKNPFWGQNLTLSMILMVMVVGGLGAVAAEMRHLSSGTWAYDSSMPIIPVVNVGLSPVLQFMLLPACIYYLGFRFIIHTVPTAEKS